MTAAAAAAPAPTDVAPTATAPWASATPRAVTPATPDVPWAIEEAICVGGGGDGGSSECEGRRERGGYPT